MRHGIVFLYFFAYTVGFSNLILCAFIYQHRRQKMLRLFLVFSASLTLILLEQMVTAYDLVNSAGSIAAAQILRYVSAAGCSLLIYSLTRLARAIAGRSDTTKSKRLIAVLSALPLAATALFHITNIRAALYAGNALLLGAVLYDIIVLTANLQRIGSNILRAVIRWFLVASLLMLPVLLLDMFIEKLPGIGQYFPFGLFSVLIFYMLFSGMSLYCVIRQYSLLMGDPATAREKAALKFDVPDPEALARYGVTNREREIISLLAQGYSYGRIGEELVVSLPTVKTHVYNIYRKLGVRNKIELIRTVSKDHTKV